jgi:hypothetical protein
MAKIKPSDVSSQVDYDIGEAVDFCAQLLEDVNEHNGAYALAALNAGAYDLACEFIKLAEEQDEAGELTKELRSKREMLLEKLEKAEAGDDDEDEDHVCDDDCRSYGCPKR